VDFAVPLQGLTLAKPEMVPFRLTQNIVDAFGVSGHEGVYRRVCEITLRVLREHREALASVLETFVHDPLVDWTAHGHHSVEDGAENPQARDAMATIQGSSFCVAACMFTCLVGGWGGGGSGCMYKTHLPNRNHIISQSE